MAAIKVLFVSHSSVLHGAERSLLTLICGLQKSADITPVVLLPCNGPLTDSIRKEGIQTIVKPYFRWIGPSAPNRVIKGLGRLTFNLISLASLKKLIKRIGPDLIYSNTLASPVGAMISLRHNVPHIWHAREFVIEDMKCYYDLGTSLSMSLIGKSSKLVCNSYAVKEKLEPFVKKKSFEVVYNGFNFSSANYLDGLSKFDSPLKKPFELLILGQVQSGKGQEDALRALAVLASKNIPIILNVVGSASGKRNIRYFEFLNDLSRSLHISDKVVWRGFVSNPLPYLAKCAVALICSRSEAFGRVAVEAMALSTPVVSSNTGGLPEIIDDGTTGLLYTPGDYNELAQQVERLLTDKELYKQIAAQARKSVTSRFTVAKYVSQVANIIHEVCKNHSPEFSENL